MWGGGKTEERPQAPAAPGGECVGVWRGLPRRARSQPLLTVGPAPLTPSPPCHPPAGRASGPTPAPLTKEARSRGEGREPPLRAGTRPSAPSFPAGGAAAGPAPSPPSVAARPSPAVAGCRRAGGRGVSQAALPGCATLTHSRAARRLRAAAAPAPVRAHASRASLRASGVGGGGSSRRRRRRRRSRRHHG